MFKPIIAVAILTKEVYLFYKSSRVRGRCCRESSGKRYQILLLLLLFRPRFTTLPLLTILERDRARLD